MHLSYASTSWEVYREWFRICGMLAFLLVFPLRLVHLRQNNSLDAVIEWCSFHLWVKSLILKELVPLYSYSQVHASPMYENCLLSHGILGVGLVCFHTWDDILTSSRQMLRHRFMSFCSFLTFIIHHQSVVSDVARLGWLNAALPWEFRWGILADFIRTRTLGSHETF